MTTDEQLGTFDDVMGGASDDVRRIAVALRDRIATIHPEAVEVPRAGERSVSYGLGPKKMSEAYAYLMPQTSYVNLGFFYGTDLEDPSGTLEGTGKKLRHVKVRSVEQANGPEVSALLARSIAERKKTLGRG
jgi:hypothetical protein